MVTQTVDIQRPTRAPRSRSARVRATAAVVLLSGLGAAAAHGAGVAPKASGSAEQPRFGSPASRRMDGSDAPTEADSRIAVHPNQTEDEPNPGDAARAASDKACPPGMVEIRAKYCSAVAQVCLRYIGPAANDRCAEFSADSRCVGAPILQHFCVDEFEYPNLPGVIPLVNVTWDGAQELCEASGKRLCTDSEWTLACEGPERSPYPYGLRRDPGKCNIDKSYIVPDDEAYANPSTRDQETARLNQAEPAGTRAECVSGFGVHDLTGNVDEWVTNERGSQKQRPYMSGLKGGYWGPVRSRCRPMTVDHGQWHIGYQIGFRCCSDAPREDQNRRTGSDSLQDPSEE